MKTYLGDAVYADWDGHGVVLTTEDGYSATNRIILEPETWAALVEYVIRLTKGDDEEEVVASSEKCWTDANARGRYSGDVAEEYARLLQERKGNPCTPEEQAGPEATMCADCKRPTVHQYALTCMICGAGHLRERSGRSAHV